MNDINDVSLSIQELKEIMTTENEKQKQYIPKLCKFLKENIISNHINSNVINYFINNDDNYIKKKYILKYLNYIYSNSNCSPSAIIIGVIYLERMKKYKKWRLFNYNFKKLLLISIMVASKMYDDNYISNGYWAQIGNMSLRNLNKNELNFIFEITFLLIVKKEEYDDFLEYISTEYHT
jgi:hypothetical protein